MSTSSSPSPRSPGDDPFLRHLPMTLTYSRMFAAPVILAILIWGGMWAGWWAAGIFLLASLTDWLDGFTARRLNIESNMGKFMDPIADKVLVLGALVMLLDMNRVDPVMVFLLLGRDIFIGGLRAVAATNQVVIAAKPFGKWKTALQMVAIPCLLISERLFGLPLGDIGYFGLWVSVILSLISAGEYARGYYRSMGNSLQRF